MAPGTALVAAHRFLVVEKFELAHVAAIKHRRDRGKEKFERFGDQAESPCDSISTEPG